MPVIPLPLPRRLSPEASRDAALDAARDLLVEFGPQAVTLKAVAARVGRTHANLLHHFGSAQGLQEALIARMAVAITATIRDAALRSRAEGGTPREVVDLTFDAFGRGGAGALAGWMILSGNEDALNPILDAIHDLVDELSHRIDPAALRRETLHLVLTALGDALLGPATARALGLPVGTARDLACGALLRARAPEEGA